MHLDIAQPQLLEDYLKTKNWLKENEQILILEKPGEGNMNYTVRVRTHDRTFIVKQSRAYVEKYPQIAAPVNRAIIEGRFYEQIQPFASLNELMPQLIGMDEETNILVLEDLGTASDYTFLYQPNQTLSLAEAEALAHYIAMLHRLTRKETIDESFANREMRALNHEHIFQYPFMLENGFDLDTISSGLQMISMAYKVDETLKQKIKELGLVYLADGRCLLHGDFYPGSWLKTLNGVKVIDPEFCFYGPAEFDLGVMTAHLMMTKQSEEVIRKVYQAYGDIKNPQLVDQFTGIEIMRRLIGLAQLPLTLSLLDKEELLETAYELIMKP
ncbi:phosphotransferase [Runella sp. MFBS21]|uniref:phosphotransferase n=1 Tax=Runella sp. MFBS21 TaxID=3034018 RepID=UPI0023F72E5E|nr:phosphotransferase [Runella sp. MFBS21]MDF7820149.1 phosphotransferase [Runella sp. MFBS21]